jgi:hypothetical protein
MASPSQPQGDYEELSQLAARISQHLLKNPKDAQARQDLHYVVSQMQGGAAAAASAQDPEAIATAPAPNAGMQVASGVSQIPGDFVKGIISSVLHPQDTLGQLSGVANREQFRATVHDPEASLPEKIDAFVRATPFNAGYAPMRAFLQSTGAKTDEPPAPLSEQVRQGGDIIAGLLTARYGGPAVKAGGRIIGKIPFVGPAIDAVKNVARRPVAPPPIAGLLPVGADIGRTAQVDQTPLLPALRAAADPMETTPAYVRGGNPRNLPTGLLGGAPGHPIYDASLGAPTTSVEVRGGERLLPSLEGPVPLDAYVQAGNISQLKAFPKADIFASMQTLARNGAIPAKALTRVLQYLRTP